jgi:hypothetical protein
MTAPFQEAPMFRVVTPVVIVPSVEARHALGPALRPAARAAWHEIARRGEGIEMAHFQIVYAGITLAASSRIRRDGFIEIALALGDPKLASRVISAAQFRRDEARARSRSRPARRP